MVNRHNGAIETIDREPQDPSFAVMSTDGQLEGMISREDVRALKETTQES